MRLQETYLRVGNTLFQYHYLCHYLSIASGKDTISRSLLKFKRGAHPDLDAWIDCALEALAENPPSPDAILLRALGHRETTALNPSHSSLDLLCQNIALRFGCRFLPTLLSKTRETTPNKGLSRSERAAELFDVYSADFALLPTSQNAPSILLIDDLLTTGATIRSIITALRRCSPAAPIRVFTLARGIQDPLLHKFTPLHGRNYHLCDPSGWSRANSV